MTDINHAAENAKGWLASIEDMLATWNKAQEESDNYAAIEDAERTIHESVLSVSVREGWHAPGQMDDEGPEEFEILLSTGGPALRIWGKLNRHCEPESAELQMQDWGTPWTRYPAAEQTLLDFASRFYFGEG